MKVTTLRTLVGLTTPLILTGSVQAGFLGISTVSKPNEFGLLVCNVYAEFDRPGQDHMEFVYGSTSFPLLIEVIGGTFYQHAFGSDQAPGTALINAFPSLAYDTFVTIAVKAVGPGGQPDDGLVLNIGWPGFGESSLEFTNGGYGIVPGPQSDPFNPLYFAGDGRVLIAQYSTADGSAIQGTMVLSYVSNGIAIDSAVSFYHVPGPGSLWLLGAAGLLGRRRR